MQRSIFYFVILIAGMVKGNEDCNINPVLRCNLEDFKFSFPENEEEVINTCNSFKANLQCVLNFTKKCGGEEGQVRRIENVLLFAETNCQESSPIYQGAVGSLNCIRPLLNEDYKECTKTDDRRAMIFFTYLMELSEKGIENVSENDSNSPKCLDILYYDACSAAEVGMKCGFEARNSVVEIMQNLDFNLKICRKEIVDDLMTLVDKFESSNE